MSSIIVPTSDIYIKATLGVPMGFTSNVNLKANIFNAIYPTYTINVSINTYLKGNSLFKYVITAYGAGTVAMTYPFTTGQQSSINSPWFTTYAYTYMTITATPTYGHVFNGWYDNLGSPLGNLYSTVPTINVSVSTFGSGMSTIYASFT